MINREEIEKIFSDAGEIRAFRARKYFKENRVKIDEICDDYENAHTIISEVRGTNNTYYVEINEVNGKVVNANCTCMNECNMCKHVLSTLLQVQDISNSKTKLYVPENIKYMAFEELVDSFSNNYEITKNEIHKEVKIMPIFVEESNNKYSVCFKIGINQMYKIKSLVEFLEAVEYGKTLKYGINLEFKHTRDSFDEESIEILEFILKYAKIIKYLKDNNKIGININEEKVYLEPEMLDEIFDLLLGQKVAFELYQYKVLFANVIEQKKFIVEEINETECKLINLIPTDKIICGKKFMYFFNQKQYCRFAENSQYLNNIFNIFYRNNMNEIVFTKSKLSNFFTLILPRIDKYVELKKISESSYEKYVPKSLKVKLFFDVGKYGEIICEIKFCYGDIEFNPFDFLTFDLPRNLINERNVIDLLDKTGFKVNYKNKNMVLEDDERIYEFLSTHILSYMEKFEVLATEKFKTNKIKQPKIGSVGVKIENGLLKINFTDADFEVSEIKDIMQKYKLKKKYHRLKNGTFISLEDNSDINFISNLLQGTDADFKDIEHGSINLPVHRSLYLNKLLGNEKNKIIIKDGNFEKIVQNIDDVENNKNIKIPKDLNNVLRDYQKTGYRWLKALDSYKFGGILADDMGLGKTLQVITLLLDNKGNNAQKTSIVVCPSSLVRNWENEVKKFADEITTLVISGKANERKSQISTYSNYDLIITSYDSLKRDIEVYDELNIEFKYAIADEAQYIKNGNTQNAKSIKMLRAETRYALTGTPIENSLAELWSIFDFIMPGYLFKYSKFKRNYELPIIRENDNSMMEKLKMMIEPFVLRRNKKDVLTELPEKTITLLYNDMENSQKELYLSYLSQTKNKIKDEIENNRFEKSKLEILALLTRLRQICCHPSLFIENYSGESGKLEQCLEIINGAIDGGHKILLFSSYTSMFDIFEKELKERNIKYFKLTGQTKLDERITLVDEFNKDPQIKVFLISLKAGGTGLNLTGADIVIHYDPWWNIAAENQATDRAYRIGQKKNVQVYKLITKDSIEEKINELQSKKAKLIDDVLSTEETFINKLSKEDILALFE